MCNEFFSTTSSVLSLSGLLRIELLSAPDWKSESKVSCSRPLHVCVIYKKIHELVKKGSYFVIVLAKMLVIQYWGYESLLIRWSFNNVTPIALAWHICHCFLLLLPSSLSSFSRTTHCNNPPFYSRFSSLLSLLMFISTLGEEFITRWTFHKYHDVQLGTFNCSSIKDYF